MSIVSDHAAIEGLLGAFALDAVDVDERAVVEEHLAACASCRAEVAEHREVAAVLSAEADPAPERIWDRIAGDLAVGSPKVAPVVLIDRGRRNLRSLAWLASAAAVVVVALGAAVLTQSGRIDDLNSEVAAQQQEIATLAVALDQDPLQRAVTTALADPDARVAELRMDGGDRTTLIVVLPDGTGYVYENTLEPLSADATYQLWAVVEGKVISAGVLGNRPGVVPFHIDPAGLEALVITAEVAGGVPQSQEAPVVAWSTT
jgi:anti-sigma factor RsiW